MQITDFIWIAMCTQVYRYTEYIDCFSLTQHVCNVIVTGNYFIVIAIHLKSTEFICMAVYHPAPIALIYTSTYNICGQLIYCS